MRNLKSTFLRALSSSLVALSLNAQAATVVASAPELSIAADRVKARINPHLYGLMTEEINFG